MLSRLQRSVRPRRGVTLVETLVVVALVVLMMVILVQVFQSALGAMSASRTTQELDVVLRSIDSMIRSDLNGVTAKMTPPNDPALKQGYFEYGENAPADLQGEDTDDFLAFTTRAPEGQVFTGRQWLSNVANSNGNRVQTINQSIQPAAITSQVAEIIYFLRNGNLYRRVFLVAPERANSGILSLGPVGVGKGYSASIFGNPMLVSWQGMNDISCRPLGNPNMNPVPVANDLGDLTNRENRAFRPRFSNDFLPLDGLPDDNNSDGIPDYYPTLYYNGNGGHNYQAANHEPVWSPNAMTAETVGWPSNAARRVEPGTSKSHDVYAFPFIFPGMYSVPDGSTVQGTTVSPPANNYGWRHGLFAGYTPASGHPYINHTPLDLGDNLPAPALNQTWWGFPTWRETMTFYSGIGGWGDPVVSVNMNGHVQPVGLRPLAPQSTYGLHGTNFLPQLTQLGSSAAPPFSDGAGSSSFIANASAPNHLWEDELILTHVRSFDVKAYDPDAPLYSSTINGLFSSGYQDLGYGAPNFITGYPSNVPPPWQPNTISLNVGLGGVPIGFGHEGRMPPITNDNRLHPRRPTYATTDNLGNPITLPYNVGDNNMGVTRLVHTFDTWSTAYTNAPDSDILLNGYSVTGPSIYPSYPPPYPSPLRGIQIQVRVTDPRNERTKVLTIRFDFTDKL